MQFRPVDIAKECNVSVGTVRSWCAEFSEFLSAGANPTEGERKLNEHDLEVCRYIAQLRTEGMSKPQIALRLRETSFGTIEKPTEAPQNATEALQAPQKLIEAPPEAAALSVVAIEALQKRIDAIEANSRAKTLQFGVSMFAAGFCAACVLFLIVVVLISIYAHR